MGTLSSFNFEYSLAIKKRGTASKPWRWEIYVSGKRKSVRQSDFFETMSEATRAGKAALAGLKAQKAA
jgi:hypothetical protein